VVDEREERQARNEALIRLVNERIDALDKEAEQRGWPPPDGLFEFHCECGRAGGCAETVAMTLAEYERVRSQDDRFAVAPGHESPEIETVVARHKRFLIVDKIAAAEPFVATDPRGAASE
jgi:hypothetical protein